MAFVQASGVSLALGERDLLKDVTLTLSSGDRVALTGANGSGKTTLMKILAGETKADSGEIAVSRECRISYLPQSGITHSGLSLREETEQAFSRIRGLQHELEQVGRELADHSEESARTDRLLDLHHQLQEQIQESGFYSRMERIQMVLSGLGFSSGDFNKPVETFSGGWQMRIALAKVLLEQPDIMLLDEPTNYLDLEATDWLKDYLSSYSGGILLVSHDRFFLDATVREVYELFSGNLGRYKGNFSEYEHRRSEELETLLQNFEKQQEEISRIEDFIARFRSNASKAQLVQSRIKQLEKIERIEIPETMQKMHFSFPPAPHSGRRTLLLQGLKKAYGENVVLQNLDLEVERGEKIVVAGKNGAGKSTLMRIIAGRDISFEGELVFGKDVKPGYFSQEQSDTLNYSHSVFQEIEESSPLDLYPKIRNLLGAFLFRGDDVFKQISVLSGGEKSRLSLLKLLLQPVNFLILDEPTNHLDMHSKDILLKALKAFSGTILFVSHDRYFIEGLATKVLELGEKGPRLFYGNYSYYLWKQDQEDWAEDEAKSSTEDKALSAAALSREELKRNKADLRRYEREEEHIMLRLEELDQEHSRTQHSLSEPDVYLDGEKVKALQQELDRITAEQTELSEKWETVEAELSRLRTLVP